MTPALDILRRSLGLYRSNGQMIVGYAAWLLLTAAAFVLTSFIENDAARETVLFVVQVADLLLWIWIAIIVTRIALDANAGKTPNVAALPTDAWALIWPFAWVTLLQGLTTVGGFLLFILPGFVFLVWFAFAQQALLIDGKRGLDALAQSREMCRGRFFDVAWRLFLGPFLIVSVYLVALTAFFALVIAATQTPIESVIGDQPPLWMDVTATVTEIFLMPLLYVYWTLTYLELRRGKSGGVME